MDGALGRSPAHPIKRNVSAHFTGTPDEFAYVSRYQAETSGLFELISSRYERRSMLITANQPFGDPARPAYTRS